MPMITMASGRGVAQAAAPSGWALVWSDEFSGAGALNSANWDYEVGAIRNSEAQYYQSGTANANQSSGNLEIEARIESVGGKSYTSASCITLGKQAFETGRIDIRMKVPSHPGSWCAAWFMGTNIGDVGWPACGEFDLVEVLGHSPTKCWMGGVHTTDNPSNASPPYFNEVADFDPSVFHDFSVRIYDDRIESYLDGVLKTTFNNDGLGSGNFPFGTGYPVYLILNYALGGSWGGAIDNGGLPAKMLVDYVRFYEWVP